MFFCRVLNFKQQKFSPDYHCTVYITIWFFFLYLLENLTYLSFLFLAVALAVTYYMNNLLFPILDFERLNSAMFLYQNLTGAVRMYTNWIYKLVHVSIFICVRYVLCGYWYM